jgi:two-component system phosphate regulon response regulator PhoB
MVMLDGQAITLTRMQHRLLAQLVQHAGKVLTRPFLLMQIRGYGPGMGPRRLAAHIHGLRRRLGAYAEYIETVPGVGYRFWPMAGP